MSEILLDQITRKLLGKFGQGSHKPGSGSAAAFNSLLAAELLRTVIDLTLDKRRLKEYYHVRNKFLSIKGEIDTRIYPQLEKLIQLDSDEFDKVIKIRSRRDETTDASEKATLTIEARLALIPAIEIPLTIARLSIELANYGEQIFDHGFSSARGDSCVAIYNAVATIGECLAIVALNLQSCFVDDWHEKIRDEKAAVKTEYLRLHAAYLHRLDVLEKEADDAYIFGKAFDKYRKGGLAKSIKNDEELELLARSFQNALYKNQQYIWKGKQPESIVGVLKPDVVLRKVLGYTCIKSENLGYIQHEGDLYEVAGLIDRSKMLVESKSNLPNEISNFTLAHELAHLLLHDGIVMHRDRAIEGPSINPRTFEEAQADKFAAYFLMPGKLVRDVFEEIFLTEKFEISGQTALGLRVKLIELNDYCKDLRTLARLLAGVNYFAGRKVTPICEIFNVSIEAMAIRLEELNLISFRTASRSILKS